MRPVVASVIAMPALEKATYGRAAALGAGVGAGVGAGIDALRHARSPIPHTRARVTVAPVLGKEQRAVVALVRF